MAFFITSGSHPVGLHRGAPMDVYAWNRSGSTRAVGDVIQFDLTKAQAETTTVLDGADSSIFSNYVIPAATIVGAALGAGSFYGVVMESTADNNKGRVRVQGECDAFCIAASGSIAVGSPLIIATAYNLDLVVAAGEPYHAFALAALTTPTTRTLCRVMFDGIGNMGTFVS